ncbi:hypothetical protein M6B38_109710 [Iris pallida]|uniref:Secreted protein n=1 Tax=Iris pallida TaxID=29817 RepID=A0AAX6E8P5_IRIPA|nr:hypothetical protein M6B38_109710 [Iris pallida]
MMICPLVYVVGPICSYYRFLFFLVRFYFDRDWRGSHCSHPVNMHGRKRCMYVCMHVCYVLCVCVRVCARTCVRPCTCMCFCTRVRGAYNLPSSSYG